MASQTEIRILIVDDHALVRDGMTEILSTVDEFAVVGEAGDAQRAITMTAQFRPDVILLDVEMGDSDVTKTVTGIRATCTECRIIILSMHDDPVLVRGLVAQGVSGYLVKNATRQELIDAIRRSLNGTQVVLSSSLNLQTRDAPTLQGSLRPVLSSLQTEILALVADALSNAQVARRLALTEATVKRHLRVIFTKLNAVSRIDAVNRAIALGLLDPPHVRYADFSGAQAARR